MSNTININSIKQTYLYSPQGLKYQFADFILCTKQNILIKGDQMIPLNKKAIQCLILLVANANKVVLRKSFFNQVWNDCCVEEGVLTVNISCLRKILGKDKIRTYSGRGYIFTEQVKVIEDRVSSIENTLSYQIVNPIQKTKKSWLNRMKSILTSLIF